jgi:glycosyltransferase involved in cell wall biosynthesis
LFGNSLRTKNSPSGSLPAGAGESCAGHVGMLVHSYYPGDSRVRREAEALAEAGYRVDIVCLRFGGGMPETAQGPWENINGVFVHRMRLARKRGSAVRYFFEYASIIGMGMVKLAALHLAHPFDVVHVHNMPDFLVMAGIPFKWFGAKLVLDVHDPMPEIFESMNPKQARGGAHRILSMQESWSNRRADFVITANEVLAENLIRKGLPAEKVATVNNFPDPKYFKPLRVLPPWPKTENTLTLIYSGTITGHYQVDDIVHAVSLLVEEIPGIRLLLVGSGQSVTGILDLAAALGIGDRVAHHRRVDLGTLRDLINSADVGVSTHVGGPFGELVFTQKLLDYMSLGLPVVANRARASKHYIPEEAVYYYESGSPRELADQVLKMVRDPELLRQKREIGLELCGEFSWTSEKRKLVSLYRKITAGEGAWPAWKPERNVKP